MKKMRKKIFFNHPLMQPGEEITVFTYPYLRVGTPSRGEAKVLIARQRMEINQDFTVIKINNITNYLKEFIL